MSFDFHYGLPWSHPAVVLNYVALFLYATGEIVLTFVVFKHANNPYYRWILGGIAMQQASLWGFSKSESRLQDLAPYALTGLNVFCSVFFTLLWIAYLLGSESAISKFVFT